MTPFEPCPRCGDDVGAIVSTDPGIETMTPCGCRVAVDGGEEIRSAEDSPRKGASPPPELSFASAIHDGGEFGLLYNEENRDEAWILVGPRSFQEVRDAR